MVEIMFAADYFTLLFHSALDILPSPICLPRELEAIPSPILHEHIHDNL
jgi:hypothetical protein